MPTQDQRALNNAVAALMGEPTPDPQARYHAIRKMVRATWRERVKALGYKRRRADDAVMDYLTGVRAGLLALQEPNEENRTAVDGLLFIASTRGSAYVERDEE